MRRGGILGVVVTAVVMLVGLGTCARLVTIPDRNAAVAFEPLVIGAPRTALYDALRRSARPLLCSGWTDARKLPPGAWKGFTFNSFGGGWEVEGYDARDSVAFKGKYDDTEAAIAALREHEPKLRAIADVKFTFMGPSPHRVSFVVTFGPDGKIAKRIEPYGWD